MRWRGKETSSNVEDRRGGRGGTIRRAGKGFGIGTIIIFVLAILFGENPLQLIQQVQSDGGTTTVQQPANAQDDELGTFVKVVLKYNEEVWDKLFREQIGKTYRKPVLVLFERSTQSACGYASAATGPFYCPADQKIYIDLSFYQELSTKFGASGDFAMAYVISHEVAHHVQNLLGITGQVDRQRGRVSKAEYNQLSVKLELQADFLAGVWARHAHQMDNILEEGDVEEALRAASAIGDDRIQMKSRGYVVPESFTHGTSEQRVRWFRKGIETGDINQGDTFSARNL